MGQLHQQVSRKWTKLSQLMVGVSACQSNSQKNSLEQLILFLYQKKPTKPKQPSWVVFALVAITGTLFLKLFGMLQGTGEGVARCTAKRTCWPIAWNTKGAVFSNSENTFPKLVKLHFKLIRTFPSAGNILAIVDWKNIVAMHRQQLNWSLFCLFVISVCSSRKLSLLFLPCIPFLKPDTCLLFPCVLLSTGSAPASMLTKDALIGKLQVNWSLII